jgi:hypothetical protein
MRDTSSHTGTPSYLAPGVPDRVDAPVAKWTRQSGPIQRSWLSDVMYARIVPCPRDQSMSDLPQVARCNTAFRCRNRESDLGLPGDLFWSVSRIT